MTPAANPSIVRIHLVLALVAVLFSGNYILGKIALAHFEPLSFAFVRVAISAALLLTFFGRRSADEASFTNRDKRLIVVFAVLGVVINQVLFITGLAHTTAHHAAILITSIPVFTLVGALMLGRERLSLKRGGGIALAASGALLIVLHSAATGGEASLFGDLLILTNCFSYGLYLVVSKRMMLRYPPIRVVTYLFCAGAVMMFPLAIPSLLRQNWSMPNEAWWSLAGVVAGPTVAAYVLNAWALRHAESSLVAAYSYVQPIVTAVLATVFLTESIRPTVLPGTFLIFAGVFLASRKGNGSMVASEFPDGPP